MNFSKLTEYLDSLERVGVPGCDMAVWIEHAPVYRHFTGYRDIDARTPMDGGEIYWIFSLTKIHTCVAALQLMERGVLALDDAVSKYLPAFGALNVVDNGRVRAARGEMTLRHLFTMQGGLTYDLETPSIKQVISHGGASTRALADAFAREPLAFDPGTHFKYSLCHDALAAVVEVASGARFSDYLRKNIWEPLGIKDTGFTLTPELRARLPKPYLYDERARRPVAHPSGTNNNYQLTPNYESGGAGLLSSTDEYMLLSDALACGGVGKSGKRILESATIDLMRQNQLTGQSMEDYKREIDKPGYGYGLGVRTLIDESYSKSAAGEFGWDGAACAYTFIDPTRKLSAFFGIQMRGFGYGYSHIHPTLRDLVYESLPKP